MSFFKFRGAASIQPTSLFTRPVICLDNSKSLRAIYSVNNFYPPPHDHPSMHAGRFCVSAASRFGQGRVFGFADSTVFSNFEIFYPGKYEFLLNAVHWLNHEDGVLSTFARRCSLAVAGLLLAGFLLRSTQPQQWLLTLVAATIALCLAQSIESITEQASSEFPLPVRPAQLLLFAADPEDPAYVLRGFSSQAPYDQRYDVFIQWVLRTGTFSGFYVTGKTHRPGLFEYLNRDSKMKTGLALIMRDRKQMNTLPQLMQGPGGDARWVLLAFSRQLDWEIVAKALGANGFGGDTNALTKAKSAWPAGEVILDQGNRRLLLVFSIERFSDQAMGFSEKVVPSDSQQVLFGQEFSLIDGLFKTSDAAAK
jgi:hypothetical protein